ncbi:hypothetical protein Nepgr_022581 [Nepenthes gracilis]|uniref:Major facilitator superfamily (MFS) profile domain-containing protein n=1 Tax=Nepenthes gracilis TaxID=150966 RepID=A0AAD3T109_NEPGR|nr:hypothetical protein Nepgr_022581 [Nepenthes gracilis]
MDGVTMDGEQSRFTLPVDSEHKATVFPIFSVAKPHMRAFHLSWLQFFSCSVSSFAGPPLLPIIRDNLNLTATSIGNAGIAAVSGAVFARLAMGAACDLVGPRVASAWITFLTAPAVYCSSMADSAISFLLVRFFTGFSLATFVSTQFWMTSMFSPPIVGRANGLASGWGDIGGGATQVIMPLVYALIVRFGVTNFTAWRIAFFIPAILQTMTAYAVMIFGQDTPDGDFLGLQKSGKKHKDNFSKVFFHGIRNNRAWLTALCYGFCFGVVLTMNNMISQYFYDRFDLKLHNAGIIAASFGLMNIFARPGGGVLSDMLGRRLGMRGRLWGWWIFQTLGGVLCILLGRAGSLGASVALMLLLSIFIQASCGLTFGVVPFVSRRAMGVISGITGSGGNIGAVLIQVIFFKGSKFSTEVGITYMGIMVIVCTLPIALIYFPQWGGMIRGPKLNYTERDYYLSEWTEEEQQQGFHKASMKFAENSMSERSRKIDSVPSPAEMATPTHV